MTGKFRQQIQICKKNNVPDALGGITEGVEVVLRTCRAKFITNTTASEKESLQYAQSVENIPITIVIRNRGDINLNADCYIKHKGVTYYIDSLQEKDLRGKWIEIKAIRSSADS